ncbi:MAG TPA: hypothetical protein VNZ44_01625 [Pyrinomonadaceae bacterium]|nr:hypothetical protein [Pyrinomonadaceae bacterium]
MAEGKRWIVTASGDRPLKDVKKELADEGFNVEDVLDEIGCITGQASEAVAEKLRSVRGVADVSPEPPPINIGPPDASVS